MKSTIGAAPHKPRIYPKEVLQAVMNTGLQNYSTDEDYYMLKYNGTWYSYEYLMNNKKFLGLPVIDLKELEVKV